MNRIRVRLTYSDVVATLALFLVLAGGTAFAATRILPKNSVGARQLKKGAVTPAKLSKAAKTTLTGRPGATGATGPQGPQGDPGRKGEPGEPATKLFAQIKADGTVNASSVPVSVDRFGTGTYFVDFGRDVSHCAAFADQGGVPVFGTPATNTGAAQGYGPRVDISSDGGEIAPGFIAGEMVAVETFSGSSLNDSSFYLTVLC